MEGINLTLNYSWNVQNFCRIIIGFIALITSVGVYSNRLVKAFDTISITS